MKRAPVNCQFCTLFWLNLRPWCYITFWHIHHSPSCSQHQSFIWVFFGSFKTRTLENDQTYSKEKTIPLPDSFVGFAVRGGLLYPLKKGFSQFWQLQMGNKCPRCTLRQSVFTLWGRDGCFTTCWQQRGSQLQPSPYLWIIFDLKMWILGF